MGIELEEAASGEAPPTWIVQFVEMAAKLRGSGRPGEEAHAAIAALDTALQLVERATGEPGRPASGALLVLVMVAYAVEDGETDEHMVEGVRELIAHARAFRDGSPPVIGGSDGG